MKDSEFLAELKAAEELIARGYERVICPECKGLGGEQLKCISIPCIYCGGRGTKWEKKETKPI